ncbi:hypothetical protein E4U91_37445 [Streptomyces lasalocidi]|uniref:Secreted protein n=2 Tax=Streptomyces lasalocidi TaxID=324833 RepID=A0A4U5W4Q9_STRLS|nr:hypothetical protein [Streptomyces lasalocidi]TKS96454.1 hypothetical protein E4U91_37445 [Streptomyces lasalocidi]
MRKLRTAAVLIAVLGNAAFMGAGFAQADQSWGMGDSSGLNISQSTNCESHDSNIDVLGQVGIGNGLGGNLLNGEGNPGSQQTSLGSSMGCSNKIG